MPLYEFQFRQCQQEFECLLQVEEDYAKLACPRYAERSPKKLISSFRTNTWSTFLDRKSQSA